MFRILTASMLLVALAGCASPDESPRGPVSFQASEPLRRWAADPNFPGLNVTIEAIVGEGLVRFEGSVRNDGPETYQLGVPPCGTTEPLPWNDQVDGPPGQDLRVEPARAAPECAPQYAPFAPGETKPYEASWNGTLWTPRPGSADGTFQRAPAGDYFWHVQLPFRIEAGASQALGLTFALNLA